MVEVIIDGHKVEVAEGSMVMHAVEKLGQYVPHFCYHKKLSIAANCRMCLVDVEKAPKPMPACATPVTQGMVVHTKSEKAVKAQQGVMEFLLINHPLDCPICDQGGECQLQDLAVGYGAAASRYTEEKRVVFHKPLGPLISAEEMARCIHCTRCVRFGQEVAGVMELGMLNRGEHSEITSFLGKTIDSELSGNMIDICPVGALTSKPFRYSARTWELSRRKSISPHDALGSNITVQVKANKVMRVVPYENEAINECWISDRDRFSYEGLNSADRLTVPMVKQKGVWTQTDWPTALSAASTALKSTVQEQGGNALAAFFSATSTLEEIYLLKQLTAELGSKNIDFRLRMHDFSLDAQRKGAPWLGMPISEVSTLDRVLIVGSFLRREQPLLAARIRQAVKKGTKVSVIHSVDEDLLMPLVAKSIVRPSLLPLALAQVAVAVAAEKGLQIPAEFASIQVNGVAQLIAKNLLSGKQGAILLGAYALNHPEASTLHAVAQWLSDAAGVRLGVLPEQGNTVGAYLLKAFDPQSQAEVAARHVNILLNLEPALDAACGATLVAGLQASSCVVALTVYKSAVQDCATIMLPVTPFTETAGSFINMAGHLQSFNAAAKPLGEARPAWKVLRTLGQELGLTQMAFNSSDEIQSAALQHIGSLQDNLSNQARVLLHKIDTKTDGFEQVADIPPYNVDAMTRRAESLQKTVFAKPPVALFHPETFNQLGLQPSERIRLTSAHGSTVVTSDRSEQVPAGAIWISAGRTETQAMSSMFGALKVEQL
jgi:NADH-quinone oxidoreductase subunit G